MVLLTGGLFRSGWLVDGLTERLRYRYPHIDVNHYGEESPDGYDETAYRRLYPHANFTPQANASRSRRAHAV